MKTDRIEAMMHLQARLRTRLYTLLMAGRFKEFGRSSRIIPPFTFWGLNQISVADNVVIQRDCWIHIAPGGPDDLSVKIIIKSHASIGKRTAIAACQQVVIEEYVMLGSNCLITDQAHAFKDTSVPIMGQGYDNIKPVCIGRETWVGNNVSIQPGVTIGRHCVIGTNSVVIASIPDYSVAVGMPARVVKTFGPAPSPAQKEQAQAEVSGVVPSPVSR